MDLRDIIPGYSDALDAESRARELPLLGISDQIGPFHVRHMTLRDYLALKHHPLLCNQLPTAGQLVVFIRFLWVGHRSKTTISSLAAGWLFGRRCLRFVQKNYVDILDACESYLEETFVDSGSQKSMGWTPPYYSEAIGYIGHFSRHYPWATPERVLEMPMKLILQYRKEIENAHGITPVNRSDQMIVNHTLSMRRN